MKTRLSLLVAAIGCFTLVVHADDWPQWRGPERTGISKETGLLKAWPKDGPKLLWQIKDLDGGYSTPAIVGDRLYVLSNKGSADEFVQARSIKDGKQIWSTRLGKVGANVPKAPYPGSRSTATVDGDLLYALGSDGDLVCAKTSDGTIVWRKSLRSDFSGAPGLWAYSESPLVDGDVVVCTPGGDDATLVALDKKKGTLVWKSAVGGDQAAYASIIIVEVAGLKQYVQFVQNGLVGVDAKTGKFLWRYDKTAMGSLANIPTPIAKNGYIYSSSGKGGAGLVKLKVEKDAVTAEQVYFSTKAMPSSIGGSVLVGDSLYGTNSNGLLCVDFVTGKDRWQDRSIGAASVCYADGRLYLHGEKNGDVALIEATPEGYREQGRFTPPGQPERGKSSAWAYPVVANGRLYLRDLGVMWCYDVAAAKK